MWWNMLCACIIDVGECYNPRRKKRHILVQVIVFMAYWYIVEIRRRNADGSHTWEPWSHWWHDSVDGAYEERDRVETW